MDTPQWYFEVATGHVSMRKRFIKVSELPSFIDEVSQKGVPAWRSYYAYDDAIIEYCNKNQSVRNFDGLISVESIIVDVDKGTLSDEALLERLRQSLCWLEDEYSLDADSDFQVWFSGTGFHVELGNAFHFPPSRNLHMSVKETLMKHFPFGDNIYDKARLIRLPHTINEKSRLYKIPLSRQETIDLSMPEIRLLAGTKRTSFSPIIFNGHYPLEQYRIDQAVTKAVHPITTSTAPAPTPFVTCMQTAYQMGPITGSRHESILRISSAWRRGGLPYESVVDMMQRWVPDIDPEEVRRAVHSVYNTPLEYGCTDPIMAKYCSSKCRFFKYKNLAVEAHDMKSLASQFKEFMSTDFEGRSFNLRDHFVIGNDYMFYPGEFVLFFGDTKLGKTAFIQNLVVKLRPMKVLYCTLEVHQNVIFRRFIQIAHGLTKHDVMSEYARHEPTALEQDVDHIHVVGRPHSIVELESLIASHQPRVVVIDTTDGLVTKSKDMIAKTDELGHELKNLANRTNTIVIGIHHIPKGAVIDGQGLRKRLTIHSARGAATLEHKADKIISIEEYPPDRTKRVIIGQGARDEGTFQIIATMNVDTFQFIQNVP